MAILNVDWRNKHCSLWSYCSIGFSWLQFCFHHCESMKWCNSCATCTILNTTFFHDLVMEEIPGPTLTLVRGKIALDALIDLSLAMIHPIIARWNGKPTIKKWGSSWIVNNLEVCQKPQPDHPKKRFLSAWGAWQIQLTKSVPLQSVISNLELVWPWIKGMIAPQESTVVLHDVIFK